MSLVECRMGKTTFQGSLPMFTDHSQVGIRRGDSRLRTNQFLCALRASGPTASACMVSFHGFHALVPRSKQGKTTQNNPKQGNYRGAGSLAKRARRENPAAFCKQTDAGSTEWQMAKTRVQSQPISSLFAWRPLRPLREPHLRPPKHCFGHGRQGCHQRKTNQNKLSAFPVWGVPPAFRLIEPTLHHYRAFPDHYQVVRLDRPAIPAHRSDAAAGVPASTD